MEKATIDMVTRSHPTQLLLIISTLFASTWSFNALEVTAQALLVGFKATPSHSVSSFQPLLSDSTGNFSLGFLRVNQAQLSLTVIHNPTLQPLWQASPTATLFSWSEETLLFFNGSLVLSDQHAGLFWSTATQGDKVVLLNSSNLQILKTGDPPPVVWQSFDSPTDTLVENQDFRSGMTLVSSNGAYSMRLGDDYMGLYAKFQESEEQIYWKHKALEAKAAVVEGNGPISARINSAGYIGMYQNGSRPPVDVQPFNSFQRPINRFLLVRVERDGNLKGYYWDGANWGLDYQAIPDTCQLPSPCGPYGLCRGSVCSCLDNTTRLGSGQCYAGRQPGDLCSGGGDDKPKIGGNNFWVLRRKGVDLPYKELMGYRMAASLEQCEGYCEGNCSCWGAVYNSASGFCYLVDYPIQTLLGVGDEGKMGYFKVRKSAEKKTHTNVGLGLGLGVGVGVASVVLGGSVGLVGCKIWRRRRRRRGVKRVLEEDEGVSPGSYKNLGSPSFSSIEMSPR